MAVFKAKLQVYVCILCNGAKLISPMKLIGKLNTLQLDIGLKSFTIYLALDTYWLVYQYVKCGPRS